MSDDIEIFEEHGGVLYSRLGKAEVTYFGHQISVQSDEIKITPNAIKFSPSPSEKSLFLDYSKPLTGNLLFNKSRSAINELAFFDCPEKEKAELLKKLRSEINELLKKI